MIRAYVLIAGAVLFMAIVAVVGYQAEAYGENKVRAQWTAERLAWEQENAALKQQKRDVMDAAAQQKEDTRNAERTVYRTIVKNVPTYIDRPVYSQPCMDADGLRDINQALAGRLDATRATHPADAVPAADAARRPNRR
jgi:hypothetical protein